MKMMVLMLLLVAGCSAENAESLGNRALWGPVSWESFGQRYTNVVVDWDRADAKAEEMLK